MSKKIFKVTIEEQVSETFEIEATDIDEAMEIAEEKYNNCDIIVAPGNLVAKLMMAEDKETGECTEWNEF